MSIDIKNCATIAPMCRLFKMYTTVTGTFHERMEHIKLAFLEEGIQDIYYQVCGMLAELGPLEGVLNFTSGLMNSFGHNDNVKTDVYVNDTDDILKISIIPAEKK